ncbi:MULTISPECIES: hypothetical protein [unclassified Acinetobacter]|uniref:hypothetical protein n=1 Tax=unclassified Acinetobacter TaxID=196816 RepID=UPI00190A38C5|nr:MULTISPECIES: hypothetical protein [unclassified Acinetobacter]MBK0062600.1 hypothetical protein [Acinetobacter sp. S55]MBK0065823.1 hypothetical protein [Acinetobacter sp. S54]
MTHQTHGVVTRLPQPHNHHIHIFPAFVGPVHPAAVLKQVLDYSVQERMYQLCLQRLQSPDFAGQIPSIAIYDPQPVDGITLYLHPAIVAFLIFLLLTSVYLLAGVWQL